MVRTAPFVIKQSADTPFALGHRFQLLQAVDQQAADRGDVSFVV
jgi:hypothetical protein